MNSRTHIAVAAALIAAVLGIAGCSKEQQGTAAAKTEPPPVRTAVVRVEPRSFNATVPVTGTLVSPASVVVKAETTGRTLRFPKEEGDAPAAGEPVVWVDDSHEKLAVRQAESAVQVAEASLERTRVMQAHSRSEYVRARNLLKSGGITDRDYKSIEIAERDAGAQVALASAQLEQAQSQRATAAKMLQESIVYAPISGEIGQKLAAQGGYVEPPTAVFSVVDNSRLELESMVATANLGDIRPGQAVAFTVNAFPQQKFIGRVIDISPAVGAQSRSAKVRIRVDNAGRRLRAGMFGQGEILTGTAKEAILIPASAAYRDDRAAKSSFVFVVENGRAVKRKILIGRERDSLLEVTDGLRPGDILVAEQSIELAEGVRVAPELRQAGESEQ